MIMNTRDPEAVDCIILLAQYLKCEEKEIVEALRNAILDNENSELLEDLYWEFEN